MTSTFLVGALVALGAGGGDLGESLTAGTGAANDPAQTQPANGSEPTPAQEVVVTGSRIASPNLKSISPVTAVSSAEIEQRGAVRIEDVLNQLPQVFSGQGSMLSNGASGTAEVNLRDLGSSRTLVLINGRRLGSGDPGSTSQAADLNFIPTALVDRVDVLTGGASATYGSDAVAGVVNFVMKQNFQGLRLDAQYSGYLHDNGSKFAAIPEAKGYTTPTGTTWDGQTVNLSAVMGVNAPDGKGNITAYATYLQSDAVKQSDRDFSACTLAETDTWYACSGSGTTDPTRVVVGSSQYNLGNNTIRKYVSSTDAFNYGPYNYYQRNDERYTFGGFGHYQINSKVEAYGELMFMDDRTDAVIAPSGVFGQSFTLSCGLLTTSQAAVLCPNGATTFTSKIYRRNVEGGGRDNSIEHTDFRIVGGARGDLDPNWHYDVYAQYYRAGLSEEYYNDFSVQRLGYALAGCPTGSPSGCVPYNIFQSGGVTKEALAYLETPGFEKGYTAEQIVSANITGKLGDYGVKSPWATDGVAISLGTEYRRESLDFEPDAEFTSGDLAGQGGATTATSGAYDVYELFGEFRAPLLQDKPFAQSLSLEGGYRFSDYSTVGTTGTYKAGIDWQPVSDIRFRGSFNHAVRAPNLQELYSAQSVALDGTNDPCAGTSPSYTAQQCAYTGVSSSQYKNIIANSANQYNGLLGGNPDLKAERANSYSAGFVLTPRMLPNFSLSIDYFSIKVKDLIGQIGENLILQQCASTGSSYYCNLIHRDSDGQLDSASGAGYVVDTLLNTGSLLTSGVDVNVAYRMPLSNFHLDNMGSLSFSLAGTYLDQYRVTPVPGGDSYDCAGLYGPTCVSNSSTAPLPRWRHTARVTWQTPWNVDVSAAWRYYGEVKLDAYSSQSLLNDPDLQYAREENIHAYNYLDLTASWRIKDNYTLRVGVNNVFDTDPPIIGSSNLSSVYGNGNTMPQAYDALGRYMFINLSANF